MDYKEFTDIVNGLKMIRNRLVHSPSRGKLPDLQQAVAKLNLSASAVDQHLLQEWLLRAFHDHAGITVLPDVMLFVVSELSAHLSVRTVCDPFAGIGMMLAAATSAVDPERILAFSPEPASAELGRILMPSAEWLNDDAIDGLADLPNDLDLIVAALLFGAKSVKRERYHDLPFERYDLGSQLIVASCEKLSPDGQALFVVPQGFFFSPQSARNDFVSLDLSIQAAFALPKGSLLPYTSVPAYLVVVRKKKPSPLFVAELSNDKPTNRQVLMNFRRGEDSGSISMGRFVDPDSFSGIDSLRIADRLRSAEARFGYPDTPLSALTVGINLGKRNQEFEFPPEKNAILVPLIGTSKTIVQPEEMTLKPQNYAQVTIDPDLSLAPFVAQYLNSELGKAVLDCAKTGVIPNVRRQMVSDTWSDFLSDTSWFTILVQPQLCQPCFAEPYLHFVAGSAFVP